MDISFTATIQLATNADSEHAAAILDHHAEYHPAVVRTGPGRAHLILTLPAEDLDHATTKALGLIKAIGYHAVRVQVMTSDDYDRRIDSLGS
jgi:hypothetical protein